MKIIPAIDLIDGKCVRLTKGDFETKKVYNENPLEVAKSFEDAGVQYLHLVDLDGAKAGRPKNLHVLESLAAKTNLIIDFGGGIREFSQFRDAIDAGANQVNLGSITVKNEEKVNQWMNHSTAESIIFSADVKGRKLSTHGWLNDSGPDVFDYFRKWINRGAEYFCSTQIAKDGTLKGADVTLYNELSGKFPEACIIASGGIGSFQDVLEVSKTNVFGCIIGKAIYEGKISLKELQKLIELC